MQTSKISQYQEALEMVKAETYIDINMDTNTTYAEKYKENLEKEMSKGNSTLKGATSEYLDESQTILVLTTGDGNKFTITENGVEYKGNDENSIIKRAGDITISPKEDYGKVVTGYNSKVEGMTWRLFYVDNVDSTDPSKDTVYLIADKFIKTEQAPKKTVDGTTYTVLGGDNEICSLFGNSATTGIMNCPSYASDDLRQIAVKYMLDKEIWTDAFGDLSNKVDYVTGGLTIEQYCASYKDSHPTKYLECQITQYTEAASDGWDVAWNDNGTIGVFQNYQSGIDVTGNNKIYSTADVTTEGDNILMWLASPSSNPRHGLGNLMFVNGNTGSVGGTEYVNSHAGFCPIVCLKSGVQIETSGDKFVIK